MVCLSPFIAPHYYFVSVLADSFNDFRSTSRLDLDPKVARMIDKASREAAREAARGVGGTGKQLSQEERGGGGVSGGQGSNRAVTDELRANAGRLTTLSSR